ncbi:unnamed protein product [Prunus armeniaca]
MSSSVSGSSHENSKTTPVLVSIPIPMSSSTPTHSMSLSQSGLQPAVSQDVIFPHQVSDSVPFTLASSSNDSISDRVPLVSMPALVLRDDQLQVLIPASSQYDDVSIPSGSVNTHIVTAKSKDGIEELDALHIQGTWILIPKPCHKNVVGSKWVYRIKRNSNGTVSRHKPRLVAQGFSQEPGLDFSETFSPVVQHTTVRLILSIAAMNKYWSLRQLDVKNVFLHGDLEEEVFMRQPPGFEDSAHPKFVCQLKKSLYGLKQAPRAWNAKFTGYLPAIGFRSSHSDPSLFVKHAGSDIVPRHLVFNKWLMNCAVFEMKYMGKLTYFLGLQIDYNAESDIFVSQKKYAKELLHKAGMSSCRPYSTPSKPLTQVLQYEGTLLSDPSLYRSVVGALQYLTFTKLDLSYAVNSVCQYMTAPTDLHWLLVKRILRYIQGTLDHGLKFSCGPWQLHAFSYADWARDVNTRRSTTGFVVFLGTNPISWQSKKQTSMARSSTEAKYQSLAHTSADIAWIRQVLQDLKVRLPQQPVLHCDNLSTIALSSNPVYHSRIKHLDIDFHFVKERVQRGDLIVQYIPTEEQVADVFTKGLHSPIFSQTLY